MNNKSNQITSIKSHPKKRNRVLIYSGDFLLAEADTDVIFKLNLKKDDIWDEETARRVKNFDEMKKAREILARNLSLCPHSIFEMKNHLEKKKFSSEVISELIDEFKERGYLDDEEFARKYVKNCLKLKDWGPKKVENELRKRGIKQSIIEKVIAPLESIEFQEGKIKKLITKKLKSSLRGKYENNPEVLIQKLLSFFAQRGFDREITLEVIKDSLRDVDSSFF